MITFNMEGIHPWVADRFSSFAEEVFRGYTDNLHSLYLVGSALTSDFEAKTSDINSVLVLKEMDLGFIERLAPLGAGYQKQKIAAPLIMTPAYIRSSLDVFPVEFLSYKLIHQTLYGADLFQNLAIQRDHLRLQCEREIKSKLLWLRQGYLASLGDKKRLTQRLAESITPYMPLFRAILLLLGQEPHHRWHDLAIALQESTSVETAIFEKMLLFKREKVSLSKDELTASFEQYYLATERVGKIIDELPA